MIKAVIDTNIFISAILFGGELDKLIELWKSKRFVFLLSKEMLEEYIKVLSYDKFKLSEEMVKRIIYEELLPYTKIIKVRKKINIIKEDPSDNIFLECAEEGRADYLISGDKHLLQLGQYKAIKILTSREFIKLFD